MSAERKLPGATSADQSADKGARARDIAARLKKINLLVLVSSQSTADLIEKLFSELGFQQIYTAPDTATAIAVMRRIRIDLMVADSDIRPVQKSTETGEVVQLSPQLSAMTGVHFVSRLRNSPVSPNPFVPVIMLVNEENEEALISVRDAGVNEIVRKPMDAKELASTLIATLDHPRVFVTAPTYKGPCRRTRQGSPPEGKERRTREVRVMRYDELQLRSS